ncbi:major capsid protein [Alkanindiges sp. WGS2144]|uniref:major capsid protein n=1 Tax=Alkanindiges sp. WGS2144 TaxID=3366808 RepID=UPI0037527477
MNTQNQTQGKAPMTLKQKAMYGFALAGTATAPAFAAGEVDVGDVVTSITGLSAPVAAIGGAMLTLYVVIKGWKVVRRAL